MIPKHASANTVSILPMLQDREDGEIYIMLEERYLPVPQIQEGSARIFTTHAFRLPKNIAKFLEIEQFIIDRFDAQVPSLSRL